MSTGRRIAVIRSVVDLAHDLLEAGRLRVAGLLLLMVLSGLASGTAVVALVPLLTAAGVPLESGGSSAWLGRFVEMAGAIRLESALSFYVVLAAAIAALGWAQSAAGAAVTQRVAHQLRLRGFDAVLHADWTSAARHRASDLQEALIRSVDRAALAAHDLITLLSAAIFVLVSVALAAAVSPAATALATAAGAMLMLAFGAGRRRAQIVGERLIAADRDVHREIGETIGALKLIRTFGLESRHRSELARVGEALGRANVALASQPALIRGGFDVGAAIAMAAVIYVAVRWLAVAPAALLILVLLFLRLMPRVATIQTYFHSLLSELPAYESVRALITELAPSSTVGAAASEMLEPVRADITIDRVTAGYGGVPVLRDVSVRIEAGTTVAVVGPSGAGKTTLADVLLGLVPAAPGRVLVDGKPLTATNVAAWRAQVAVVPQEVVLFHDTVRANLAWAAPGATEADMWRALEAAAAAGFVRALPRGLDTVVGDRGHLLSGGERQRLALARAFVRQPRVIVLDEATSALDHENEQVVQRAIEAVGGATTLVVIAHRLSSIRRADRIVVIDGGRVVESGTWAELLARPHGRFARMCEEQRLSESPATPDAGASGPAASLRLAASQRSR